MTFSHGWPLNTDAWDGQMLIFLAQHGYRASRTTGAASRNTRKPAKPGSATICPARTQAPVSTASR